MTMRRRAGGFRGGEVGTGRCCWRSKDGCAWVAANIGCCSWWCCQRSAATKETAVRMVEPPT